MVPSPSEFWGVGSAYSQHAPETYKGSHHETRQRTQGSKRRWFLELANLLGSIASTSCVLILVSVMNDRPLSDWHAPISINASIAILITLARFLLTIAVGECLGQLKWRYFRRTHPLDHFALFDTAMDRPLVALEMLAKVRWWLAYVVAVISLSSLAFDPFAQQVVQIRAKDVVDEGAARAAFAIIRNIEGRTVRFPNAFLGEGVRPSSQYIDSKMQGAVLNGLFGLTTPPNVTCTANCTWDESFISLGFAADCQDVTEYALQNNRCIEVDERIILQNTTNRNCYMETPGAVGLNSSWHVTEYHSSIVVNASDTVSNSIFHQDRATGMG